MTQALELIDVLIVVGAAWALTVAGIAIVGLAVDVTDWIRARRAHRHNRRIALLEDELADTLDELVTAHSRIAELEARVAWQAVDQLPGPAR